jgi:hypothetical protein
MDYLSYCDQKKQIPLISSLFLGLIVFNMLLHISIALRTP